jgi:hypothetical protein
MYATYEAGPFQVHQDENDGTFRVVDSRTGNTHPQRYPSAKTANRRARQLAGADVEAAETLPTLPAGTPETADNYPGVAPKPQVDDDPRGPEERAYDERQEARVQAQIDQAQAAEAYLNAALERVEALNVLTLEVLEAHRPVAATREQWLLLASGLIRPLLRDRAGLSLETFRVTCGWPSRGGRGSAKKVLGEAWHRTASSDGTAEVFITPTEDDPRRVLAILAHELTHTCLPAGEGHGPKFRAAASSLGFEAPFTVLKPTDDLWAWADKVIDALPLYPHARILDGQAEGAPKKQSTRMIKLVCIADLEVEDDETGEINVQDCGYTVRTTKKWIEEVGPPICPRCQVSLIAQGGEED